MHLTEQILIILCVVLGTMLTRFLPFIIFPPAKPTPKYIQYLGKVLPGAALSLLVVYCLKDISFFHGNHALPEILSIGFIIFIHCRKRNMLLSIASGTICYILLLHFIFI